MNFVTAKARESPQLGEVVPDALSWVSELTIENATTIWGSTLQYNYYIDLTENLC